MGIVASMLQAHLVNLDRDKDVEIFIGNKIPNQKDNDNKLYVQCISMIKLLRLNHW